MRLIDMVKRDLIIIGIILIFLLLFISLKLSFGARIVCINSGTLRAGINAIGDIVTVQDDDVELTGAGYNNFLIIQVPEIIKDEVMAVINLQKVQIYINPNDLEDKYWYNSSNDTWYEIVDNPKYNFTIEDFTAKDIIDLADTDIIPELRLNILQKTKDKIPLDPANNIIVRAGRRRFKMLNTLNAEEISIP